MIVIQTEAADADASKAGAEKVVAIFGRPNSKARWESPERHSAARDKNTAALHLCPDSG